ncbi:MAG: ATP-binding cassette domain-containing protein [Anaerolineae bacterium]|nr:ATP-binding cassette domain-containing protein [Anaerolineae bacterium]MBN8617873.1 ATP-binding cassette domain-containing protein [Anaerolineae bacterium]
MTTNTAIHVEHISKSFGSFRAVDDLTFDVYQGEIFAMLGPNGAGKSTTMRMILDILKPDTGRIAVLGAPLTEATKDRIGYLPEERGLYRNVRVQEMMVYLGTLKGLSTADATRRSLDLLERLGMLEQAKKKVSELSKGMQQKIQFAVTVLHDPDLIIIDEPFSGLDPVNSLVLKDLLLSFKARGGTIVMSTHQMSQVEEMCDRLLMISKGKQKLYGSVTDIRQQYALHAIIVEGQGDWSKLPGVARIESISNGRNADLLHLQPDVTPDKVLAAIAASQEMRIERFELAVPSLNDIFIRVEGGQP